MRAIITRCLLLCLFFTTACAKQSAEDQLLQEAFNIHQQAMQIAKEIKTMLEENSAPPEGLSTIKARLNTWESKLVEVPGFEHEHEHSHGADLELLPADMLAIQKEFLDSIRVIQNDLAHYRKTL